MSDQVAEAAVVRDLATNAAAAPLLSPGDVFLLSKTPNATREVVDLEHLLPAPRRVRGTVTFHEAGSLAAYVQLHDAQDGTASLWAEWRDGRITAVLNGNAGAGKPLGWGDHRACLKLRTTPEWDRWLGRSGVMGDQTEFARHIERGALEIVDPDAATMLEIATTFEAHSTAAFRQVANLQNGARQFRFEEEVEAKGGKGQIEVPGTFVVAIAPFEGTDPYKVTAKLVYRLRDGRLGIGYELLRTDDVRRESFTQVLDGLKTQTGLSPFAGTAPEPVR